MNAVPDGAPTLTLRGVGVRWGATRALDRVDLTMWPGERLALVGPSGAGKTTLLRLLNGAVGPSEGVVEANGQALASLAPTALRAFRSRVAFIPQRLGLAPGYRVLQNVLTGRFGRRNFLQATRDVVWPAAKDVASAHALLERLGIGDKLYHRTATLSGGQQQRVAIARAMFQEPAILLADEPVSSVDPARARDLVSLLTTLAQENGLTLVMSLHNLELAREFFPRLVGMRAGRILFDSPPQEIGEASFHQLFDLSVDELLQT